MTSDEEVVWDYVSPITAFGATTQGNDPGNTSVFKTYRYAPEYPAFEGRDMTPGDVIEVNSWDWGCTLSVLDLASIHQTLEIYPNPSLNTFKCNPGVGEIDVFNTLGKKECTISTSFGDVEFGSDLNPGFYLVIFTGCNGELFKSSILKQ